MARVFFLLIVIICSACASAPKAAPTPERTLRVKFKVPTHRGGTFTCTSCGENIARALQKIPGVLRAQPIPEDESAVVYYESGKTDIDEMKKVIRDAGFQVYTAWGPEARRLDGRPELIPHNQMPAEQPTAADHWREQMAKEKKIRDAAALKDARKAAEAQKKDSTPPEFSQDKYE